MLYYLFNQVAVFSSFQFITFRAAIASVTAFLIATVLGGYIIDLLRKAQFRERTDKVHSEKLADLHASKNKTPSMGGLFMIGAMIFSVMLFVNLSLAIVLIALGVTVSMWVLGFIDDWIKLQEEDKHGIQPLVKLYYQCLIGFTAGVALYLYFVEYPAQPDQFSMTALYVPVVSKQIELGAGYPFLVMLVIVSTSNAVNLSDGLDGLAIGLSIMVALVFAVIAYVTGRVDFSTYLNIPMVHGAGELAILMTTLVGGGMGFLWYNCHPAQVFMGNTGSLPVGGLIGVVAVITKQELVLLITGGMFVIETLSVLLQIISFRVWGKRIFKIAPIHHHFEFKGWEEPKVVVRFWIAATVFAILSLAFLKL